MGMQVSFGVCAEIPQKGNIWEIEGGHRADTAEVERVELYGVSKRKKHADDIREAWEFEVQIWKSDVLVQRILR